MSPRDWPATHGSHDPRRWAGSTDQSADPWRGRPRRRRRPHDRLRHECSCPFYGDAWIIERAHGRTLVQWMSELHSRRVRNEAIQHLVVDAFRHKNSFAALTDLAGIGEAADSGPRYRCLEVRIVEANRRSVAPQLQ